MNSNNRKTKPRGISWIAVFLGIALGVGLALLYTWELDPVIERNTAPWQLGPQSREDYVIAVALSYSYNHDLQLAFDRLRKLNPSTDVWSMVADIACERHKTVQIKTNSDVLVMRTLEQLYRSQGASGCADGQYPTPAPVSFSTLPPTMSPTPTLAPPLTKTPTPPRPTPTENEIFVASPTPPPLGTYQVAYVEPFCDTSINGVIEVRVFDVHGDGVAGIPVQVSQSGGQKQTFYTGLKPGREAGYADFAMSPDQTYTVTIPNLTSSPRSVEAVPCGGVARDGKPLITSYRINFQQQAN